MQEGRNECHSGSGSHRGVSLKGSKGRNAKNTRALSCNTDPSESSESAGLTPSEFTRTEGHRVK